MGNYCNITTDLTDVFPRISQYQLRFEVVNWTATTGQSNTFEKFGVGEVYNLFENGKSLTAQSSIATVEANAASYWYDTDNDLLYVHPTGGGDPADFTLEIGEDWNAFLTSCRNEAMEMVDAWLNKRYDTPLIARANKDHSADDYEFPIRRACAALTCYLVMNRRNPGDSEAMDLYKMAWNQELAEGETKGIINMYLDGDMVRQDSVSPRESGSYNVRPYASNSTTEPGIQAEGTYTGSIFMTIRLTVTTGGAPTAGIFKVSYDGGTTDHLTAQNMLSSGYSKFVNIGYGISIYWTAATYTATDYWDIVCFPVDSTLESGSKIGSIGLVR